MQPTFKPSRISEILRDMEDLHDRTFGQILDRLPQSVDYDLADLAEALAPRAAPVININIFINQESEQ